MAIRFKINKAAYEALSDEMKLEYIAGDKDGEFVLDVLDLPAPEDTSPLKRSLEKERETVKTLKREKGELQTRLDEAPDVEALKATHAEEVSKYKKFTEGSLIDGTAAQIAAKISTAPALIIPHIKARLTADLSGEMPVTKVRGLDGKITETTLDDLAKEFVANKDFSAIMLGSKATGGGTPTKANSSPLGGGMPPKDGEQASFDAASAKPADLAARITARREAAAQQE